MVYPGGEVAFIMRMMEDSVRLGSRVHWCVAPLSDARMRTHQENIMRMIV